MSDDYDEFGNYIGLDADDSSSSEEEEEEEHDDHVDADGQPAAAGAGPGEGEGGGHDDGEDGDVDMTEHVGSSSIVLHEDKKYYPDADEVYGTADVLVQDEDTQGIEEPIIKPVKLESFALHSEDSFPETKYSMGFLTALMQRPALVRNVAVLGHLHHGKTLLCDALAQAACADPEAHAPGARLTDARKDEQERGVSIKASPTSLALEDGRGKSYVLNVVDCPGHVNFSDEASAALQVADGAILVVDAVEGVMLGTERLVKQALARKVPLTLCIAKMDRLIHELKLPPSDAYHKLAGIVDAVNVLVLRHDELKAQKRLSPARGNVVFAAAADGWTFSLESFARLHIALRYSRASPPVDAKAFAKRLWGDSYYDPESRTFAKSETKKGTKKGTKGTPPKPKGGAKRAFVQFVLEPLYKVYAQVLGEDPAVLRATLGRALGVRVSDREAKMDAKPLLRLALGRFFRPQGVSGVVDMCVRHLPAPDACGVRPGTYAGPAGSALYKAMQACDPAAPAMVSVAKLVASADGKRFSAFCKVVCGTLKTGDKVKVLGEAYSAADTEDCADATVTALALCQPRHRVLVLDVPAGNWVLVDGVDAFVSKSATLAAASLFQGDVGAGVGAGAGTGAGAGAGSLAGSRAGAAGRPHIFLPPRFDNEAVLKVALEPRNPAELPRVLHGLRCLSKTYPLLRTRVEESGEHVLFGTGELYLDCAMHDLRNVFAKVEVKLSDPIVSFCETVVEASALKTHAETPNQRNTLTMIAEPLGKGVAEDVAAWAADWDADPAGVARRLVRKYDWDKLAAKSLWAFGPGAAGANALLDDTLAGDVDKALVGEVRDSVVQGFRWAAREGPLCDEPMRGVKFRLLDAQVAAEGVHRGAGFVIPAARRVVYSSFLTATPRLMEPVLRLEVQARPDARRTVAGVLRKRRGRIIRDAPVPGSPFNLFTGFVPAIDSFGLETDLRAQTQGRAFVQQVFDHWDVVPGDPLDASIVLRPLEPSTERELAREFVVKTRRRKGLPEEVAVSKYFDDPELLAAFHRQQALEMEDDDDDDDSDSDSDSGDDK